MIILLQSSSIAPFCVIKLCVLTNVVQFDSAGITWKVEQFHIFLVFPSVAHELDTKLWNLPVGNREKYHKERSVSLVSLS